MQLSAIESRNKAHIKWIFNVYLGVELFRRMSDIISTKQKKYSKRDLNVKLIIVPSPKLVVKFLDIVFDYGSSSLCMHIISFYINKHHRTRKTF